MSIDLPVLFGAKEGWDQQNYLELVRDSMPAKAGPPGVLTVYFGSSELIPELLG